MIDNQASTGENALSDAHEMTYDRSQEAAVDHLSLQQIQDQIDRDRSLLLRLYLLLQRFDDEAEVTLQELKKSPAKTTVKAAWFLIHAACRFECAANTR